MAFALGDQGGIFGEHAIWGVPGVMLVRYVHDMTRGQHEAGMQRFCDMASRALFPFAETLLRAFARQILQVLTPHVRRTKFLHKFTSVTRYPRRLTFANAAF